MKKHLPAILLLFAGFSFTACTQRMYFPDSAHAPGLQSRGELMANIAVKVQGNTVMNDSAAHQSSDLSPSADIAFAPVNHLGLMASYRSLINRNVSEGDLAWPFGSGIRGGTFNGQRFDVGAGYFAQMGEHSFFEIYGGYGNGRVKREGVYYTEQNFSAHYHRFFIQPAVSMEPNKIIRFSAGLRILVQKFYDFQSPDSTLVYTIANDDGSHTTSITNQVVGFVSPFGNLDIGTPLLPFLKFNTQVGFSVQTFGSQIAPITQLYLSFGITFRYAQRFFSR
jgi:predicted small lipoprotein YifL